MTNHYDYFNNKICTIFTTPINRDYKEENPATYPQPLYQYFTGRITYIDGNILIIEQIMSKQKLRSLFKMAHVICIAEEEVLNLNDPIVTEIKEINAKIDKESEINRQKIKEIQKNPFIDIDSLAETAKQLQNAH